MRPDPSPHVARRRAPRSGPLFRAVAVALGLALGLGAAGCAVPVAAGLDETDANEIVLALDRAAIDATKEVDPGTEGRFRVLVGKDDAARAMATMHDEELPRPRPQGVRDAIDPGALVPSAAAEHAQIALGVAGDLERTLEAVDGVLSARVHLNLASPDPLRDGPPPRSTASVLVEHRGMTPPLSVDAVQRLVAGGVAGLAPTDVAVIAVPRAPPALRESALAHVGPIAVARGSARLLQVSLVALVLVCAALAGATLSLYARLARARGQGAEPPP